MSSTIIDAYVSLKFRPFDSLCQSVYGSQQFTTGFVICITRGLFCSVAEIICSYANNYCFDGIADSEFASLMYSNVTNNVQENIFIIPPQFYGKDIPSDRCIPKILNLGLKQK